MAQQLEQEVKLEVAPDWTVPDLTGAIAGAQEVRLPLLAMEATYFDTADLRLARQRVTLRLRRETEPGGATVNEWTVKLPSDLDGDVLARQELTWAGPKERGGPPPKGKARPGRRPGERGPGERDVGERDVGEQDARPTVHPGAAKVVEALSLGMPLVPIAQLSSTRRRVHVLTSDGRRLAEVDHDTVTGRRLLPDDKAELHFDEVEVELPPGSAIEVLRSVVARLCAAGAEPSNRVSKLKMVLGEAEHRSMPSRRPPKVLADVLQAQAATCLEELQAHGTVLRSGAIGTAGPAGPGRMVEPEPVHKCRVAVRRFRTVLRSFERELHRAHTPAAASVTGWTEVLGSELRWLSQVLGAARDADVRLATISQRCAELPPDDVEGSAEVVAAARDDRDDRATELAAALTSDRYLDLLRALEGLARPGSPAGTPVPPQLWDRLTGPAGPGTLKLARQQWQMLRNAVRQLPAQPAPSQLHRIRRKAKRLRYMAEVAGPVGPRGNHKGNHQAAKRTVKAAAAMQDVLGDWHDEVLAEAWLRNLAGPGRLTTAAALAAGQLVAGAAQRRTGAAGNWQAEWAKLEAKEVTGWLR